MLVKGTRSAGLFSTARELVGRLKTVLLHDGYWTDCLSKYDPEKNSMHLAVMKAPYLRYVLEGKKTVESRFSMRRVAPYNRVEKGDVILLKDSGGPILGVCQAAAAWYYKLDPVSWRMIKMGFLKEIYADPEFWIENESAAYATLIRIERPSKVEPIDFPKRDRRGWVVIEPGEKRASPEVALSVPIRVS